MRQPNQSGRNRPPVMPRETSARLLQAVEELRALEREKQLTQMSTPPFEEWSRRVEAKAREVFRLAQFPEADGAERRH